MRIFLYSISVLAMLFLTSFVIRQIQVPEREVQISQSKVFQTEGSELQSAVPQGSNRNAYFGELHLHTTRSFDAFVGSAFNTVDDAYRYARGEEVYFLDEDTIQLVRPLDFMAVTDHAEYLGSWSYFEQNSPNPVADQYSVNEDGSVDIGLGNRVASFLAMFIGQTDQSIFSEEAYLNAWQETIDKADEYYSPGTFTTFPAFEWTSGFPRLFYVANNHRNVIFESSFQLPEAPFTFLDGQNDAALLWDYMQTYRDNSGKDVLAIPHNMNISDGEFFKVDVEASQDYLESRQFNEPLFEVVQNKGQSMAHPFLSPNDEFADYRVWNTLFGIPVDFNEPGEGGSITPVRPAALPNSYVRSGLKRGLQIQKNKGVNPFKVGFIGSSDDHDGYSLKEEVEQDRLNIMASSLAVVWAEENSRESIFSALRRKETYATTGSRIQVRFFGGWNLSENVNFEDESWLTAAYGGGVPMGGDIKRLNDEHPRFLVWAMKDVETAGLDRIQIIKVWIDPSQEDERQEKIYNVAWSGNRTLDVSGNLPAVIDTNEIDWENYDHNEIGAVTLNAEWQDPDFDPGQHAAYYLRVLEVPNMFLRQQERAWSSPIYYNPDEDEIITSVVDWETRSFGLFPNPARKNGTITINGLAKMNRTVFNIKLVDVEGRVVQENIIERESDTELQIKINNPASGIYLVVINDKFSKQLVITD